MVQYVARECFHLYLVEKIGQLARNSCRNVPSCGGNVCVTSDPNGLRSVSASAIHLGSISGVWT